MLQADTCWERLLLSEPDFAADKIKVGGRGVFGNGDGELGLAQEGVFQNVIGMDDCPVFSILQHIVIVGRLVGDGIKQDIPENGFPRVQVSELPLTDSKLKIPKSQAVEIGFRIGNRHVIPLGTNSRSPGNPAERGAGNRENGANKEGVFHGLNF